MKSILTVLLVLVALSSVQARVIPADSIFYYVNNTQNELLKLSDSISLIMERLVEENSEFGQESLDMYKSTAGAMTTLTYIENWLSVSIQGNLIPCEGVVRNKINKQICDGLLFSVEELNSSIKWIQFHLSYSNHVPTALLGKDVKLLLERTLKDLIESIPDEVCRYWINSHIDREQEQSK